MDFSELLPTLHIRPGNTTAPNPSLERERMKRKTHKHGSSKSSLLTEQFRETNSCHLLGSLRTTVIGATDPKLPWLESELLADSGDHSNWR
jgi:hypothetical protein